MDLSQGERGEAVAAGTGGSWRRLSVAARIWFCLTLLVTAILCLVWSHWKLFWVDEMLEFYTDTKPSAAAVFSGQLHRPFSLEPPAYHLLLHALHQVIPSAELAARLPSMVALLLTEVCVFFISLRRRAGELEAVAAMLLPLVLVTVDYGPEARVYGALTACLALALLSWQAAASADTRRGPALVGTGAALGCGMLFHYYGVLLALPLLVGEGVRTLRRRRVDWGVAAALLLGCGALALDLPFERALAPFRLHYYATGETSWWKIPVTYAWFFLHWWLYTKTARQALEVCMLLALVFSGFVLYSAGRRLARRWDNEDVSLDVALLTAALLPVAALVLAQVSKAYVPRYSLPAVVGLAVLCPAAVFQRVRGQRARVALCAGLLVTGVWYGTHESLKARAEGTRKLAELSQPLPPGDEPIFVQNLARYLVDRHYAVPAVAARMVAFSSRNCELHWSGRDPSSLFAENISATTTAPAVTYRTLTTQTTPQWVLVYHDPDEEWIWRELKQEGADVQSLGPALGGELLRVRFRAGSTCDTEAPRRGGGTPAEEDAER